jgi:hypothetical protein
MRSASFAVSVRSHWWTNHLAAKPIGYIAQIAMIKHSPPDAMDAAKFLKQVSQKKNWQLPHSFLNLKMRLILPNKECSILPHKYFQINLYSRLRDEKDGIQRKTMAR